MLLKTLVISAIFAPALAEASVARIDKVGAGSSVKVQRGTATVRLHEGDSLEAGDEVSTDANTAVDIRLEDESLIRVGVNSSYKVQEDSKLHMLVHKLLSGVVRVLVTPRKPGDPQIKFRLETPEGTIGVRGTEFVVLETGGKTQVKGLDGRVVFGGHVEDLVACANCVTVTAGFESEIGADGKAPGRAQKFNLREYLNTINGSGGAFGPLNARAASEKRVYARDSAAPVPVPSRAAGPAVAVNTATQPQPTPPPKKPVAQKKDYQTLLLKAALEGDVPLAQDALKHGADIDAPAAKSLGHTPLQVAMLEDKKDMFMFLVKEGANVDIADEHGYTPMMFCAVHKLDMEFVYALVNPGAAELDLATKDGKTAADIAKEKGYEEMAKYLNSQQSQDDYDKAYAEKKKRRANKKPSAPAKGGDDGEE